MLGLAGSKRHVLSSKEKNQACPDKPGQGEDLMLKRVDPLLNADILYALCAMGHGDRVVIADANFPGDSVARETAIGQLLRMDVDSARALEAVLSVLPVEAAGRMEVMGKPDEIPAVQGEAQGEIDKAEPGLGKMDGIERFAFYEEAKQSYCVIQTAERRFYGCFILTKGVIAPDA